MLFFVGYKLDERRAELRGPGGEAIKLRPKTFDMLRLFAENAGRVLSKQELMEALWPGVYVSDDSLFQCIREIRTALGDDRRKLVRNIPGRGYMFETAVTRDDAAPAETLLSDARQAETPPDRGTPAKTQPIEAHQVTIQPGDVIAPHTATSPPPDISTPSVLPASLDHPPRLVHVFDDAAAPPAAPLTPDRPAPDGRSRRTRPVIIAALAGVVLAIALAVSISIIAPEQIFSRSPPTIMVMRITQNGDDPQVQAMAMGVTDRLATGLSRIENIRVIPPTDATAHASLEVVSSRATRADYVVKSELSKDERGWTLRGRMTKTATGEIVWASAIDIADDNSDLQLQQSRLVAGIGYPLASRINTILNDDMSSATETSGSARVTVEQAMASINNTTPERFRAAQAMLEAALVNDADNIDLQTALAALQLRGIQMVWYNPQEREAAKIRGQAMLERALRAKPTYIPVLEGYCRFLSATNRFIESLVACARTLSFNPWDGSAIYLVGLDQIFLGRFEDALATFKQADQYNTPTVGRWTWTLGAGLSNVLLGRDEDALPWLQRSLAITQGTGRTHLLMVAAYQRLGRFTEAQATLKKALELRPNATTENVGPPTENTSPVYLEATERIKELLAAAGLPKS